MQVAYIAAVLGGIANSFLDTATYPAVAVMGVLAIFAPLPAESESGKSESFINNLKNAHFSLESVALILIGFTSTATFHLWLNCAQTFGKEIAGIPS